MQSTLAAGCFWSVLSQIWHVCPQEVSILKSLNYDRNITQFYGACIRPGQDLMLVTEVRARAMVQSPPRSPCSACSSKL